MLSELVAILGQGLTESSSSAQNLLCCVRTQLHLGAIWAGSTAELEAQSTGGTADDQHREWQQFQELRNLFQPNS